MYLCSVTKITIPPDVIGKAGVRPSRCSKSSSTLNVSTPERVGELTTISPSNVHLPFGVLSFTLIIRFIIARSKKWAGSYFPKRIYKKNKNNKKSDDGRTLTAKSTL